jgi:hypothetical protein
MPKRIDVETEPTDEDLEVLSRLAAEAKDLLNPQARPFVVEFAGMPRAGKTNAIDNAVDFLRGEGLSSFAPAEGASQVPQYLKEKSLVALNLWTVSYAVTQLLESIYVPYGRPNNFVFLDRGLFDATAWFSFLARQRSDDSGDGAAADAGGLEETRKSVSDFVRIQHLVSVADLVLVFVCTPDVASKREDADRIKVRPNRLVTSPEKLEQMREVYEENVDCYEEDFGRMVVIDTSKSPSNRATAFSAIKAILTAVAE